MIDHVMRLAISKPALEVRYRIDRCVLSVIYVVSDLLFYGDRPLYSQHTFNLFTNSQYLALENI